jgi:acetoin utilization deacetylase AcuC-like enzyme
VLPGQGDREYKKLIKKDLIPAFERFKPQMILISTGFDGHEDDDMSGIRLTTEWYNWIMEIIMGMAEKFCKGRLISILEGGYCIERLPELARNHVKALLDEK